MTTQPEALRLADRLEKRRLTRWVHATGETPRASGYVVDQDCAEAAAELRRLHGENEKLRALIVLDDAEWRDKHIYPVRGAAYQAWLVHVYLPVPLSASDKSPEAALKRALKKKNHE